MTDYEEDWRKIGALLHGIDTSFNKLKKILNRNTTSDTPDPIWSDMAEIEIRVLQMSEKITHAVNAYRSIEGREINDAEQLVSFFNVRV